MKFYVFTYDIMILCRSEKLGYAAYGAKSGRCLAFNKLVPGAGTNDLHKAMNTEAEQLHCNPAQVNT